MVTPVDVPGVTVVTELPGAAIVPEPVPEEAPGVPEVPGEVLPVVIVLEVLPDGDV